MRTNLALVLGAVIGLSFATPLHAAPKEDKCKDKDKDRCCESACQTTLPSLVGTWRVENLASGETGQVTFFANGTYRIDAGSYQAGGSFPGVTSGTYEVLDQGRAIGFRYATWTSTLKFSRVATVHSAAPNRVSHSTGGHTHGYEVLTRM